MCYHYFETHCIYNCLFRLFRVTFIIITLELINRDISSHVGKPHTFQPGKILSAKISGKDKYRPKLLKKI